MAECLLVSIALVGVTAGTLHGHTWTDRQGRTVEAEFLSFADGMIRIKRASDGKVFEMPLERLSDADQEFVKGLPVSEQSGSNRGHFWKGNVAERRSAIADAAGSKTVDGVIIQAIIDAMAVTAHEVEPHPQGLTGVSPEFAKAMGQRPVLIGASCGGLLAIGSPAFEYVMRGLDHEDRWVRLGCAWVLGRMGNEDAAIPLSSLLVRKDEDENVRVQAAKSLEILNDPRCARYADQSLRSVPMTNAGFSAMMSLLVRTDTRMAGEWVRDLGRGTQPKELRRIAARSAGMLSDQATGDLLRELLADQETMVRLEAARSLGIRQDKGGEALLLSLASKSSENAGVRTQAAWALARLGNSTGTQILQQIAADGPDFAKSQARQSLEALTTGKKTNLQDAIESMTEFEGMYVNVGEGFFIRID